MAPKKTLDMLMEMAISIAKETISFQWQGYIGRSAAVGKIVGVTDMVIEYVVNHGEFTLEEQDGYIKRIRAWEKKVLAHLH